MPFLIDVRCPTHTPPEFDDTTPVVVADFSGSVGGQIFGVSKVKCVVLSIASARTALIVICVEEVTVTRRTTSSVSSP
jgi:hypothetical protein